MTQRMNERSFEKHHHIIQEFKKGEFVMVMNSNFSNYKTKALQPKFTKIYEGPYMIKLFKMKLSLRS